MKSVTLDDSTLGLETMIPVGKSITDLRVTRKAYNSSKSRKILPGASNNKIRIVPTYGQSFSFLFLFVRSSSCKETKRILDVDGLRWLTREAFFLSFCVGFYTSLVVPLFEVSVRGSQKYEFWLLQMVLIEFEGKRVLYVVKFFFRFVCWKFFLFPKN